MRLPRPSRAVLGVAAIGVASAIILLSSVPLVRSVRSLAIGGECEVRTLQCTASFATPWNSEVSVSWTYLAGPGPTGSALVACYGLAGSLLSNSTTGGWDFIGDGGDTVCQFAWFDALYPSPGPNVTITLTVSEVAPAL